MDAKTAWRQRHGGAQRRRRPCMRSPGISSAVTPLLQPALGDGHHGPLAFIGQDNINNARAAKNLMTMGKNDYVGAGKATKPQAFLPGVKVHVLGPPTVKQQADVSKQRASIPMSSGVAGARTGAASSQGQAAALSPTTSQVTGNRAPPWARWTVHTMRQSRAANS